MNTAQYVTDLINNLKKQGVPLSTVAWQAALACVGWPYIFGDRGEYCTPANRRVAYNRTKEGKNRDNIKAKCQGFDSGSCSGCKWYPTGQRVRAFDCRGFTYWVILQTYGFKIMGAGATSQWNNAANWSAKGKIADGFPKDTLVCLFYSKDNKEKTWEHTGLGYNNETVECSAGVQHFTQRNKKWTHWAIPKCVATGEQLVLVDVGKGEDTMAVLKNGSRGNAVKELQQMLNAAGFDCGKADGIFGAKTEFAVAAFQAAAGLTVDGKAGDQTITALKAWKKTPTTTTPDPSPTINTDELRQLAETAQEQATKLLATITRINNLTRG